MEKIIITDYPAGELGDSIENIELRAAADVNLLNAQDKAAADEVQAKTANTDYKAECALMVNFTFDSLGGAYPALNAIYTESKRVEIAAALVPICEAYGWTLGSLSSAPWFGLLLVSVPLIAPTYAAIKQGNKPAAQTIDYQAMRPIMDTTDATSLHTKL